MLSKDDPHIVNVRTGQRTKLRRVGRSFLLDMWTFSPKSKAAPRPEAGFTRR